MPTANESNVYSEANSILAEDNAGDNEENRDLILQPRDAMKLVLLVFDLRPNYMRK